jgi:hypothetical protein
MRDLAVLFLHLLATVARLAGPGGARAVVAESILIKQQLLILNRSRKRSPNLRITDRVVAAVCTLFMHTSRLARSAIVLKPQRSCVSIVFYRFGNTSQPSSPSRASAVPHDRSQGHR